MTRALTVDELVARLIELDARQIDVPTVTERLADGALDEDSLRPYVAFADDHYTRQLVHRDALFDVIVLCWRPGQITPIHNHAGQLGWVRLVRGLIDEQSWGHPAGGPLPDLSSVDIDAHGVGHGIELAMTGEARVSEPGTVVSVDRQRAIHRLGHPGREVSDEPTVTLHVYSRPHDGCLVFDPQAHTCKRRKLVFDNEADPVPAGIG